MKEYLEENEREARVPVWLYWIAVVLLIGLFVLDAKLLPKAVAISHPQTNLYWGDNSGNPGGRTHYTKNSGKLPANMSVLNSKTTNQKYGDERIFVGMRPASADEDVEYTRQNITGTMDEIYEVRVFVVNDNEAVTAQNVRVRLDLKSGDKKQLVIAAYIYADNANPTGYWSKIYIDVDEPCQLGYVNKSARIIGADTQEKALDTLQLVTDGVRIGDISGRSEAIEVIMKVKILSSDVVT